MISQFQYKKTLQKGLIAVLLCLVAVWLPVWIFAPLCFLAVVFIPRYFAVLIPLFLYDMLYGAPVPSFFNISFVAFLLGFILIISIEFLRTRVFVNELF